MPLAKYIDLGLNIGLGSDVGAGHTLAMNQVIISAVQNSKLRHVLYGDRKLVEAEAFYLATKGNGKFFEQVFKGEKIGSFEEGSSFDALVIKDDHPLMDSLTPIEQLQRFLYCGNESSIKMRFLNGDIIR
jgi:guanine deaminase